MDDFPNIFPIADEDEADFGSEVLAELACSERMAIAECLCEDCRLQEAA